jgi:predicted DNA-binding transcriptional regulator AlpA
MSPTDDLVDEIIACRILGGEANPIHRSTLWRGIKSGRFPKPIKIGPATNRWSAAELTAVVERAIAAREAA